MNVTSVNSDGIAAAVSESHAVTSTSKESSSDNSAGKVEQGENLDNEALKALLEDVQRRLSSMNVSVNFTTYGKHNDKIAVTVTDKDTGKVIREIPARDLQNLYMKLDELLGLIFNDVV
jgi:flagellar protein FlaG